MAEIIDLTAHIKKREEKELDKLSSRLAALIEDMDLADDFEMFMSSYDDQVWGMPYIYTCLLYTSPSPRD